MIQTPSQHVRSTCLLSVTVVAMKKKTPKMQLIYHFVWERVTLFSSDMAPRILPTMTYECQTWSLNKQMTNKLRTAQRAMERKMLDLKLKDKIPCSEIRKRTKIIDIIEYTMKQKWTWAGHIARLKDNRWTRRCTEWQPRRGKRTRGRPSRRWQDDITEKEGTTWIRKVTDRRRWKTLMKGYILQWMDKA